MRCDRFHAIVIGMDPLATDLAARPDLASHAAACAECREWFGRFAEGAGAWRDGAAGDLAGQVMAATSGDPCLHAQTLLASAPDEALTGTDRALVDRHLERCGECRSVAAALAATAAALPTLADAQPDPGFVAAVLARTSQKPDQPTFADRARAAWDRAARRPRFAWEVAYAATLCWVLVTGGPVSAFEWSAARVSAVRQAGLGEALLDGGRRLDGVRTAVVEDLREIPGRLGLRPGTVSERLALERDARERRAGAWWPRTIESARAWATDALGRFLAWWGRLFRGADPAAPATEPPASSVRSRQ